jgi:hypothetical protein
MRHTGRNDGRQLVIGVEIVDEFLDEFGDAINVRPLVHDLTGFVVADVDAARAPPPSVANRLLDGRTATSMLDNLPPS